MNLIFEERLKCRVPTESNKQKKVEKKTFVGILNLLTKRAGSRAGSVIKCADPITWIRTYDYVTDPELRFLDTATGNLKLIAFRMNQQ
jgi:hypothetical protein